MVRICKVLIAIATVYSMSMAPATFGQTASDAGTGSLAHIGKTDIACDSLASTDDLEKVYKEGSWDKIRTELSKFITQVQSDCNELKAGGVYLVEFLTNGQDENGNPVIPSIVRLTKSTAGGDSYNPYNARLIPSSKSSPIYDIRLMPRGSLTAYNGAPLPNPLSSSISKFVTTVVSGISKSSLITTPVGGVHVPLVPEEGIEPDLTISELKIPDEWDRFSLAVQDNAPPANRDVKSLSTKYTYGPGILWDLGLGGGFPVVTFGNKPVKVDSSKVLTSDPPTGLLAYAAVYRHFHAYDETAPKATPEEQNKLFFGIALTPNPGVVGGYAWSPKELRSISFQIGTGALLANVLRNGDHIGSAPAQAGKPTRRGALGVAFIGLGYSL